jgi:hypothetical protein
LSQVVEVAVLYSDDEHFDFIAALTRADPNGRRELRTAIPPFQPADWPTW